MKRKMLNTLLFLCLCAGVVWAEDRSPYISEAYLKETFTFKPQEEMKYAKCPRMQRGKLCYYVWGKSSPVDKMMPIPVGNQVRISYGTESDVPFDYVVKNVGEVETVNNLGKKSVWSTTRKELFTLLENGITVSVYINAPSEKDPKGKSIAITKHLIPKLK